MEFNGCMYMELRFFVGIRCYKAVHRQGSNTDTEGLYETETLNTR